MNLFRLLIQGLLLTSILLMMRGEKEGPVIGILSFVAALGWSWLACDYLFGIRSVTNMVIAALDLGMAVTFFLRGRRAFLGGGRKRRRH